MFDKWKTFKDGIEIYGMITDIKDVYLLSAHPQLPSKKITVNYKFNGSSYMVTQVIKNILPIHKKTMIPGNYIRMKIVETRPQIAYINEYDYPEYKLWKVIDKLKK